MPNSNVELVEKAVDSLSFTDGGALNPEQQKNFIKYVKKFSTMLGMIRIVRMRNPSIRIDKLWINKPITRYHLEDTNAAANASGVVANQVELNSRKTKSYWYITTEALQSNIEQDRLEMDIQSMMMEQMATDFENLFINGDNTLVGTDEVDMLLKTADGILKLAEESHIHSFGGANIGREVFRELRKTLPKQYLRTKGLQFWMPDGLWVDFADMLADRGTAVGDSALLGNVISPYGFPITRVEMLPDDLAIDVTGATSAVVVGSQSALGPFEVGTGNTLKLDIDNVGAVTIVLSDDTLTAGQVANAINAAIYADAAYVALDEHELYRHCARDYGDGRLTIESPTTGAASEVDVQAVANDAYTLLGLTAAAVVGAAAGAHKSVEEGGLVLFTHPNNLILGILDGTRIYANFNEAYDRIETYVYNQLAIAVENTDGMAFGVDVRVRPF